MPAFPRTILPVEASELDLPGPLISKSQAGRVNIRSTQQVGRTWTERYLLKVSQTADRAFLATVRNLWRNGTIFDIGHVDYATLKGAGGGTPLINQPAQLVTDPENFGAWVANTVTPTGGQADPFGGTAAYLLDATTDPTSRIHEVVTFTGNATKATIAFLRAGTSPQTDLLVSGAAERHRVRLTWTAGVPAAATQAGSGTIYTPLAWDGGPWYLLGYNANGVVAADSNEVYIYPDSSGGGGTVFAFGVNAWNAVIPGGYIGPSHLTATGNYLFLDGATASVTNWLRAGDLVSVAGLAPSYEVTADTNSQAGGYVALPVNPPIFTGGAPADNAAVTITGVTMRACIVAPPEFPTTSGTGADYGTLNLSFSEVL